jgi:hypothetical protein
MVNVKTMVPKEDLMPNPLSSYEIAKNSVEDYIKSIL